MKNSYLFVIDMSYDLKFIIDMSYDRNEYTTLVVPMLRFLFIFPF
jgi:hypothetical protein